MPNTVIGVPKGKEKEPYPSLELIRVDDIDELALGMEWEDPERTDPRDAEAKKAAMELERMKAAAAKKKKDEEAERVKIKNQNANPCLGDMRIVNGILMRRVLRKDPEHEPEPESMSVSEGEGGAEVGADMDVPGVLRSKGRDPLLFLALMLRTKLKRQLQLSICRLKSYKSVV